MKPPTVFGLREQGAMLLAVDNLTAALVDLGLVRESELYEIGRNDAVESRHSETLRRFGYYAKGWTAGESIGVRFVKP